MDIIVDNVSKSYGDQAVLKKLAFCFPEGRISCIMMDEPLKGLDEETKIVTADYIRKNVKDKTLIVITHDRQDLELLGADKLLTLA